MDEIMETQPMDFQDDAESDAEDRTKVGVLSFIVADSSMPNEFEIFEGINLIGRDESCNIQVNSKSVSKKHAIIETNENTQYIYDLGSRNKTRKAKMVFKPYVKYPLQTGDEITFGDMKAVFHSVDSMTNKKKLIEEEDETDSMSGCDTDTDSESMLPVIEDSLLEDGTLRQNNGAISSLDADFQVLTEANILQKDSKNDEIDDGDRGTPVDHCTKTNEKSEESSPAIIEATPGYVPKKRNYRLEQPSTIMEASVSAANTTQNDLTEAVEEVTKIGEIDFNSQEKPSFKDNLSMALEDSPEITSTLPFDADTSPEKPWNNAYQQNNRNAIHDKEDSDATDDEDCINSGKSPSCLQNVDLNDMPTQRFDAGLSVQITIHDAATQKFDNNSDKVATTDLPMQKFDQEIGGTNINLDDVETQRFDVGLPSGTSFDDIPTQKFHQNANSSVTNFDDVETQRFDTNDEQIDTANVVRENVNNPTVSSINTDDVATQYFKGVDDYDMIETQQFCVTNQEIDSEKHTCTDAGNKNDVLDTSVDEFATQPYALISPEKPSMNTLPSSSVSSLPGGSKLSIDPAEPAKSVEEREDDEEDEATQAYSTKDTSFGGLATQLFAMNDKKTDSQEYAEDSEIPYYGTTGENDIEATQAYSGEDVLDKSESQYIFDETIPSSDVEDEGNGREVLNESRLSNLAAEKGLNESVLKDVFITSTSPQNKGEEALEEPTADSPTSIRNQPSNQTRGKRNNKNNNEYCVTISKDTQPDNKDDKPDLENTNENNSGRPRRTSRKNSKVPNKNHEETAKGNEKDNNDSTVENELTTECEKNTENVTGINEIKKISNANNSSADLDELIKKKPKGRSCKNTRASNKDEENVKRQSTRVSRTSDKNKNTNSDKTLLSNIEISASKTLHDSGKSEIPDSGISGTHQKDLVETTASSSVTDAKTTRSSRSSRRKKQDSLSESKTSNSVQDSEDIVPVTKRTSTRRKRQINSASDSKPESDAIDSTNINTKVSSEICQNEKETIVPKGSKSGPESTSENEFKNIDTKSSVKKVNTKQNKQTLKRKLKEDNFAANENTEQSSSRSDLSKLTESETKIASMKNDNIQVNLEDKIDTEREINTPKNKKIKQKNTNTRTNTNTRKSSKRKIDGDASDSNSSNETLNTNSVLNVTTSSPSKSRRKSAIHEKHSVIFTGISHMAMEKTIKDMGGEVVDNVSKATVLVTDKVRRTVKFLCALSKGIPIVGPSWLTAIKNRRIFPNPQDFLLSDRNAENQYDFSLERSLQSARETPLLKDCEVFVTNKVQPEPKAMKDIVSSAGGKYLLKQPSSAKDNLIVISCAEDKTVYTKLLKQNITVCTAELILRGILQQKIDTQSYLIEEKKKESNTDGSKKSDDSDTAPNKKIKLNTPTSSNMNTSKSSRRTKRTKSSK